MFDLLRLYLSNILRPVFEEPGPRLDELALDQDLSDTEEQTQPHQQHQHGHQINGLVHEPNEWSQEKRAKRAQVGLGSRQASSSKFTKGSKKTREVDDLGLLDSSGPKLIHGARSWLLLFQIVGQVNWLGVPFYLSFIYKAALLVLVVYFYTEDFLKPHMSSNIISSNYRNPIFIVISALGVVSAVAHALLTIYTNLFNLCPIFKVLTTPRLCFITKRVQHMVGTKSLFFMLVFNIYECILLRMLGMKNLDEFFNQFRLGRFVLDSFVTSCLIYYFIGVSQIDFYIRTCFGFWIIAMKTNLECRFASIQHEDRINRLFGAATLGSTRDLSVRSASQGARSISASIVSNTTKQVLDRETSELTLGRSELSDQFNNGKLGATHLDDQSQNSDLKRPITALSGGQTTLSGSNERYKLETMDEIQKNLNTMDDHLEVCRGIQTGSLVLITLNAFLTTGTILLLAYNLLANQGKYFHGIVLVLLAANNTFLVFLCYIGDSWISYALGSFVQTVEDGYFLQSGEDTGSLKRPSSARKKSLATGNDPTNGPRAGAPALDWFNNGTSEAGSEALQFTEPLTEETQSQLIIRKKDVLFCREFLHQFENHLATPWSKLTVKIHLHMLGTFVTLIAAQIIFDREH